VKTVFIYLSMYVSRVVVISLCHIFIRSQKNRSRRWFVTGDSDGIELIEKKPKKQR